MDLFDKLARVYENFLPPPSPDEWAEAMGDPVQTLLDLGGGTGRVASVLRTKAQRAIVLDRSAGMLAMARRQGGLLLVRGRAEELPFRDEGVDLVLIVDAFHHFDDHRRVLSELSRVLRVGGRVIVEEPDAGLWLVRAASLLERLMGLTSHFVPPEVIARQLAARGFRTEIRPRRGVQRRIVGEKMAAPGRTQANPCRISPGPELL
ncbi:MAG: class I SAM-dependent methyltransferase [candidate division KSB1 bacterium]|nr:class I SAM-dependent methyltransferase [candidate division KSB1 bacterium]